MLKHLSIQAEWLLSWRGDFFPTVIATRYTYTVCINGSSLFFGVCKDFRDLGWKKNWFCCHTEQTTQQNIQLFYQTRLFCCFFFSYQTIKKNNVWMHGGWHNKFKCIEYNASFCVLLFVVIADAYFIFGRLAFSLLQSY